MIVGYIYSWHMWVWSLHPFASCTQKKIVIAMMMTYTNNTHYKVFKESVDNFVPTNTQRTGDECHKRMCEAHGAQLVLRFDQFRELAEDFFEGNSHFHGMTCDTLHQCWIEQYHLLPYGLVHFSRTLLCLLE